MPVLTYNVNTPLIYKYWRSKTTDITLIDYVKNNNKIKIKNLDKNKGEWTTNYRDGKNKQR